MSENLGPLISTSNQTTIIAGGELLSLRFCPYVSATTPVVKKGRHQPQVFKTGAPDPYYKICLKNPFDLFPCIFCVYVCTVYMHTYWYRYIYEYISIMQHLTVATCSIMQSSTGAKNLWCNIPSGFFKFVVSQGWKPGGPTFSKISLLTRPGVWKPRDWDFDKKSHYHHCTGWIPEPKVLPKPLRW